MCSLSTYAQSESTDLSAESQQIAVEAILDRTSSYIQEGKFVLAEKSLLSAQEIASDSVIMAQVQLSKSQLYIDQDLYEASQIILNNWSDFKNLNKRAQTQLQLTNAQIQIEDKNYTAALESLNMAQAILVQETELPYKNKLDYIKAVAQYHINNLDQAITQFNKIAPILKSKSQFKDLTYSYLLLSQSYLKTQRTDEANEVIDKAIALATTYGFKKYNLDAYLIKSNIERDYGNYEKSIQYLDLYIADTQVKQEASTQASTSTLPASDKDATILDLQLQLEEKINDIRGRKTSTILLCVLLTLLSLLTMSLFKNNKLRARSNNVLEVKNTNLTEERDRAQDAAQIKADFLSTITHELRTPMYAVTGLTHLLLDANPRDEQVEHLQTLQSSGEYLLSLIDNILDFNKLEANKVELEHITFDLEKRVKDITVSLTGQAQNAQNQLHLEFDQRIPSRVEGDPLKISQILINLLGNAIKFTSNGNIWIRVNNLKQGDGKCLLRFEVEDNGKGISDEKQQAIFENFAQEESSTTREYGGTGLGLAIVKNLVGLMDSEIQLDSKLGRGSMFYFEVWLDLPDSNKFHNERKKTTVLTTPPAAVTQTINVSTVEQDEEKQKAIADSKPKELKTASPAPEVIKTKTPDATDLLHKKILVVEDNKINQMITRKILEGKNFECDVASDGIEAMHKARDNEYDLILMDIHMPNMDGKKATAEIRKFNREVPIIALTAVTLNESEKDFYEIGFDDIIPKPFKMEEFFEKIQKAFSNYQIL